MERNIRTKNGVLIEHTPVPLSENRYTISSNNIDVLIDECVKRIRQRSQEYYRIELRKDLEKKGKSMIDVHAGVGISYIVILKHE